MGKGIKLTNHAVIELQFFSKEDGLFIETAYITLWLGRINKTFLITLEIYLDGLYIDVVRKDILVDHGDGDWWRNGGLITEVEAKRVIHNCIDTTKTEVLYRVIGHALSGNFGITLTKPQVDYPINNLFTRFVKYCDEGDFLK
jgi:hypothetical protein